MINQNINVLFVVLLGLVKCACALNGDGSFANPATGCCLNMDTEGTEGLPKVSTSPCDGSSNQR